MIGSQEAHMHRALARHQYQQIRQRKTSEGPSREPYGSVGSVEHRTKQASTGCFESIANFFGSILNGSTLKGKILRAVVVGGLAALTVFLVSNPVGWVVAAVGVGVFAGYLLGQFAIPTIKDCIKYGVSPMQMIEFKGSAWQRINGMRGVSPCEWLSGKRGENFNHVFTHPKTGAKLYLSALPNKNDPKFRALFRDGNIGAVFSINEPWEVHHKIGNSDPYTPREYADNGIDFHPYVFEDHGLVQEGLLNQTSEDIERALLAGKNCIVHCRAGVGRSSQLIAGNLIRFHNMGETEAAHLIRDGNGKDIQGRSQATIMRKLDDAVDKHGNLQRGLRHYASRNRGRGFAEP